MDALLVVSFGGPEGPDEVMPFLERVTAGRNVPRHRLEDVAQHYLARGGVSPINAQTRELVQALAFQLDVDVYWGNRNSEPWLADAFTQMADDGVDRAAVLFTSAYSSYSGCRQYRENLAAAAGETTVALVKVPAYYNLAAFADANAELLAAALDGVGPGTVVFFTTHSIPTVMNDTSGRSPGTYARQHVDLAAHLMSTAGSELRWELVYQSRSGPPQVPWLEPDINDRMRELAATSDGFVVVPIGFISDHMEVIHDLDTEAAETAEELGKAFVRVPTVGVHSAFVTGLAGAVRDVLAGRELQPVFGSMMPTPCAKGCCPNPRRELPALCEAG